MAAIRTHSYDAARNELTVVFTAGRGYVYSLVPPGVAEAFAEAASKGAFHNDQLRDRYPFRRIAGAPKMPEGGRDLRGALAASLRD